MLDTPRQLAFACLAAALCASSAAAQHDSWSYAGRHCGCGRHAPTQRIRSYEPVQSFSSSQAFTQPPATILSAPTPVISAPNFVRTRPIAPQYYTPDEAAALYHPVVVPLDEFLRTGEPAALTRDQLARQRASAEARAAPPRLVSPNATIRENDPFADDAAASAQPADAAPLTSPPPQPPQPAREEAVLEQPPPAEQPEADSAAPPDAEPSEDPFENLE